MGSAGAAIASAASAPTPSPSPTIVSELTAKETATTNVYKLSNGPYQAQIFSAPIRFKNASGAWQSFDTSLVGAGVAGIYHAASTPVAITLGTSGSGAPPAQLSAAGYTLTWSLQNASAGVALAPGASTASYLGVGTDTTLSYKVLNWGIEQSLSLASPAAPSSFACTLSHPGLTLAQDSGGQWGLYAPGNPVPIFFLSGITVTDSALDAYGAPVGCAAAAMTVVPGSDSSTLTYTVPRSWLADPARVYPVTIDPTLTRNPYSGDSGDPYGDTIVSSGNPTSSHGTSVSEFVGDSTISNCTGYCRSLVGFDLSAIPTGAYVHSATFSAYKYGSGGSQPTTYVGSMNAGSYMPWNPGSTWSGLHFAVNDFGSSQRRRQPERGGELLAEPRCHPDRATLGLGGRAQLRLCALPKGGRQPGRRLPEQVLLGRLRYFRPKLVVNYDPGPTTAVWPHKSVYTWGDTADLQVKVNTYYYADVQWIETGLNLGSSPGPAAWRGVVGWFRTPSLVPASNHWQIGATCADGSVFAYYSNTPTYPTDYGADKIALDFSD